MKRLLAFFRPGKTIESVIEEKPIIPNLLANWRRYWDGWAVCPPCQIKKLEQSGRTEWPVPVGNDPVKLGDKCCHCKVIAS